MSQKHILIAVVVVILIAIGIFAFTRNAQAPSSTSTSTSQSTGTTTTSIDGVNGNGSFTVEPVTTIQAPNYNAPVNYGPNVTADVKTAVEQHRTYDIGLLTKDSLDFNAWMDLATVKKIAGDYSGAEAIWIYATKQWPTSPVAFNNLVDLYTNFLHDQTKASYYAAAAAKLQ